MILSIFSYAYQFLCIFFGVMPILVLCPFFNVLFVILLLSLKELFIFYFTDKILVNIGGNWQQHDASGSWSE